MEKETRMTEKVICRGAWWSATNPDNKVLGTLTFEPPGTCELEIDGSLIDVKTFGTQMPNIGCVYGETYEGQLCTLDGCFLASLSFPGVNTTRIIFNTLFIGNTTIDPKNDRFEYAVIDMTDLAGWMSRDPFLYSVAQKQTEVKYNPPTPACFTVPSLQSQLKLVSMFNIGIEYQKRHLEHSERIQILPDIKQDISWYKDVCVNSRMLMSLFVGRSVDVISLRLVKTDAERVEYVDFCFRQVMSGHAKALAPHEIPFAFPVISNVFQTLVTTWFQNAAKYGASAALSFGVSINSSMPLEFQFLALVQGLESYHRGQGGGVYLSESEYEYIRTALVSAIPADVEQSHRDALKKRIQYGYQHSLRRRLNDLLNKVPDKLKSRITYGDGKFVERVINTRNFLTHRDDTCKSNAFGTRDMFNACQGLKLLVEVLLLSNIGMPVSELEDVMSTHNNYIMRPEIV